MKRFLPLLLLPCLLTAWGQATLLWDANSEPDLAGYKVYWAGDGEWERVDVGLLTARRFEGLEAGLTYRFYVTAHNTSGLESEPSEIVSYTVPRPKPKPGNRMTLRLLEEEESE